MLGFRRVAHPSPTPAGAGSVYYLYDLAGNVITELSGTGDWNRVEIYSAGNLPRQGRGHVATYSGGASGTTYFDHADWLGTERARTDAQGEMTETCTSLAFGDDLSCSGNDASPLHFTGKQHDNESGLDDFGARYYGSGAGRLTSADWSDEPETVPYADEDDPQTLNLYAYIRNNPLSNRDADGHHQECGLTTYSTDSETGVLTVNANCHEVPDFFFCPFCSSATRANLQTRYDQLLVRAARGEIHIYASTLPIGPGDLEAFGDLENLLQDLKNGLEPTAESPALQEIIGDLYKESDKLPGGTAGAVRYELRTGERLSPKGHFI
jgi:RHS repeat-associated protein